MLSSRMTFFMKVVFPSVWIAGFGAATALLWAQPGTPDTTKRQFLLAAVVGSVLILWSCARLKRVYADDNCLHISNFQTEITVPFGMIAEVTENGWINIHPVTIHLRERTPFGRRITFMPKSRLTFAPWGAHPVVTELKELAQGALPATPSVS
jgi:hypothetical protein